MGLMWFIIGGLSVLGVSGCLKLAKQGATWKTFFPAITGMLLFLFGIAWSVSSAVEGEPQSAAMGLVFFSIPGLLLTLLGYRLFATRSK